MTQNLAVVLDTNGSIRSLHLDHSKLKQYFKEEFGFCGAINTCRVVALAKLDSGMDPINIFTTRFPQFFESTHGQILLVGSDDVGEACDVDIDAIRKIIGL